MNWSHRLRTAWLPPLVLLLGVLTAQSAEAATVRINAGGGAYTDSSANSWSADNSYSASNTVNWGAQAISGTNDPTLFKTERYANNLAYTLSLPNDTYQVRLYFAENYVNSTFPNGGVGFRIFSVQANGSTIISNLDLFATAGAHAAVIKTATVTVSNGQLVLSFSANAFVNAIEVIGQNSAADTTPPTIPGVPTTTPISTSQIQLNWNASTDSGTGVGGYHVYRNGSLVGTTSGTTFNDTGLAASTTYGYTVSAFDLATPANESVQSGSANGTTLAAAAGQVYQCNDSGATYRLAIDTNSLNLAVTMPNCINMVAVPLAGVTLVLQRWHPGVQGDPFAIWQPLNVLPPGWSIWTPNGWQTLAQIQSGGGGGSSDTTPPTVPAGPGAVAQSSSSILVSWTASTDPGAGATGVGGYIVRRNGSALPSVSGTSLLDSGLAAGTLYTYTVSAFDLANPVNTSAQSAAVNATTFAGGGGGDTTPPTVPTNLIASAASSSAINLSWTGSTDAGTGVGGYRIYRGGALLNTTTGTGTTFADSGLAANTFYSYTVTAYDKATPANESAPSGAASATTQSGGGSGGQVYQCNDAGVNGRVADDVNTLNKPVTMPNCSNMVAVSLSSANMVLQRWHPFDQADPDAVWQPLNLLPTGWSLWTPNGWQTLAQLQGITVVDTNPPTVPTVLVGQAQNTSSIQLSWNASTDAETAVGGYHVWRNGSIVGTPTYNNFLDTGLAINTSYTYTVSAFDQAAPPNESAQSSSISVKTLGGVDNTPPTTPTNLNASAQGSSAILLNWTGSTDPQPNASGVAGYRIYRNGSAVGTTTFTSFTDSGLAASTNYSYTVTAFDAASPSNESQQSGQAFASTTAFVASQGWAWIGGSQGVYAGGNYGNKGQASGSNFPGARFQSVGWKDGNGDLWLFSGYGADSGGNFGRMDDLWKYSTSSKQWTWVGGQNYAEVQPVFGNQGSGSTNNTPGGRSGEAIWVDSNGKFWMFGGITIGQGYNLRNDLWKYDPSNGQWTWVNGPTSIGAGGVCGNQGQASPGNVPGSRKGAATWVDGSGNLWLFGGVGADCTGNVQHLNDLWKFNISSGQWTWVGGSATGSANGQWGSKGSGSTGNIPSARQEPLFWQDSSGTFWLLGGFGPDAINGTSLGNGQGNGEYNDLWKYTPSNGQWTWVSGSNVGEAAGVFGSQGVASAGNVPGARRAGGSFVDGSGNFWIFGGFGHDINNNRECINDLWKYNPSTGQWTWVAGSTTVGSLGSFGNQGVAASGNTPGARNSFAYWIDNSGRLWVFGGEGQLANAGLRNDLFEF